ncbi:hypothetical protein NDU88_007538 [Pleurodeles waltl]|uniref:Uncharacterized protein n=1 Tax=Pleurodeles waltl TaxID=8319 RepID=A0AAV7NTK6_PLEWA|nr:hypothetical protein NDU88_007538 [Pleurodeles waltl]
MERTLRENTTVGSRLEGMDTKISELASETRSIRADIAGFEDKVREMEHRLSLMEDKLSSTPDGDQELQFLQNSLRDLEDGIRRDNVGFLRFPEQVEGTDFRAFLKDALPTLTSLTFSSPLDLQRAHRMGPHRKDHAEKLGPIIACFLHHEQVRQLFSAAHTPGPFDYERREL